MLPGVLEGTDKSDSSSRRKKGGILDPPFIILENQQRVYHLALLKLLKAPFEFMKLFSKYE